MSNNSSGANLLGILGIAFVVLKLTDVINWSWWWVTSPLWIPLILVVGTFLILGLIYLITSIFSK